MAINLIIEKFPASTPISSNLHVSYDQARAIRATIRMIARSSRSGIVIKEIRPGFFEIIIINNGHSVHYSTSSVVVARGCVIAFLEAYSGDIKHHWEMPL